MVRKPRIDLDTGKWPNEATQEPGDGYRAATGITPTEQAD